MVKMCGVEWKFFKEMDDVFLILFKAVHSEAWLER